MRRPDYERDPAMFAKAVERVEAAFEDSALLDWGVVEQAHQTTLV